MFSVTVRDHMMIAHSFTGEVFGPAQRLHGATFVVDATFRRADAGRRRHRGGHRRGPPSCCTRCSAELTYRNLDDEPDVRRHQHHDRGAGPGDRRPAGRRGSQAGALGRRRARTGRARPSPCTSRTSPGRATSASAVRRRARRRAGRHRRPGAAQRRQQLRPAGVRRPARRRLDGAEHRRPGAWPRPGAAALGGAGRLLAALPDGALVLSTG